MPTTDQSASKRTSVSLTPAVSDIAKATLGPAAKEIGKYLGDVVGVWADRAKENRRRRNLERHAASEVGVALKRSAERVASEAEAERVARAIDVLVELDSTDDNNTPLLHLWKNLLMQDDGISDVNGDVFEFLASLSPLEAAFIEAHREWFESYSPLRSPSKKRVSVRSRTNVGGVVNGAMSNFTNDNLGLMTLKDRADFFMTYKNDVLVVAGMLVGAALSMIGYVVLVHHELQPDFLLAWLLACAAGMTASVGLMIAHYRRQPFRLFLSQRFVALLKSTR